MEPPGYHLGEFARQDGRDVGIQAQVKRMERNEDFFGIQGVALRREAVDAIGQAEMDGLRPNDDRGGLVFFPPDGHQVCGSGMPQSMWQRWASGESGVSGASPAKIVQISTGSPWRLCSKIRPPQESTASSKWGER